MEHPPVQSGYYAVIATVEFQPMSIEKQNRYTALSESMYELAKDMDGFLGRDSIRSDQQGISVSYWRSLESIEAWRTDPRHMSIKAMGRKEFYSTWQIRICRVEREYGNKGLAQKLL